ncbi:MMOB4860 family gliding motility internal complex protein [Mycoplasmopsis agassizii]|uniref:SHOCT domain-containing protein n=1 Tax=Mycoplasmopsis agassizii TaxID=33922 RepID=A0ABX4H561_9BACT|nr:hypothetical protein [Mycoplasmopsis agassizii]PAF55030.1 hypothetical protein CJF60_04845 [Mycoplasmopsis agassizii]SMC17504.1 hypothetical protein SAMN02745179_00470 [Mycoplasmopsis agassizii]
MNNKKQFFNQYGQPVEQPNVNNQMNQSQAYQQQPQNFSQTQYIRNQQAQQPQFQQQGQFPQQPQPYAQQGPQPQHQTMQQQFDFVPQNQVPVSQAQQPNQVPTQTWTYAQPNPNQTQQGDFQNQPQVFDNQNQQQHGHHHATVSQTYTTRQQALTTTQMYMMTSPFTYPDNNLVYIPPKQQAPAPVQPKPQVVEQEFRLDVSHLPMPLNPLPNSNSNAYYNEFHKTGYIPAPNPNPERQPNPFFQQQYVTQQFDFMPETNQAPKSQIQVKIAQLDQLLANNMITPEAYTKRKQSLIDQELNGDF